jgi:hypothetical protein
VIEKLGGHGSVLGFSVSGDVTADDYAVLDPEVAAAIEESGNARLLLDLTDFRWEGVDAWGADLGFGKRFGGSIERLAIVGHHLWEKWLTRLAEPFYAQRARYFTTVEAAWDWLDE